jgi:hypothetical protein
MHEYRLWDNVLPPLYVGVVWSDKLRAVWVTHGSVSHVVGIWWCSVIHTVWFMHCIKIYTVWLECLAWSILCELLAVTQFKLCELCVIAWYILYYLCAWSMLCDVVLAWSVLSCMLWYYLYCVTCFVAWSILYDWYDVVWSVVLELIFFSCFLGVCLSMIHTIMYYDFFCTLCVTFCGVIPLVWHVLAWWSILWVICICSIIHILWYVRTRSIL